MYKVFARSQHRQIFPMAEETDFHQVNAYLNSSESIIEYHDASHVFVNYFLISHIINE